MPSYKASGSNTSGSGGSTSQTGNVQVQSAPNTTAGSEIANTEVEATVPGSIVNQRNSGNGLKDVTNQLPQDFRSQGIAMVVLTRSPSSLQILSGENHRSLHSSDPTANPFDVFKGQSGTGSIEATPTPSESADTKKAKEASNQVPKGLPQSSTGIAQRAAITLIGNSSGDDDDSNPSRKKRRLASFADVGIEAIRQDISTGFEGLKRRIDSLTEINYTAVAEQRQLGTRLIALLAFLLLTGWWWSRRNSRRVDALIQRLKNESGKDLPVHRDSQLAKEATEFFRETKQDERILEKKETKQYLSFDKKMGRPVFRVERKGQILCTLEMARGSVVAIERLVDAGVANVEFAKDGTFVVTDSPERIAVHAKGAHTKYFKNKLSPLKNAKNTIRVAPQL